jgi:oxalate decarboxylase/phosphoglucose isomerase-like protein (cupin superfamily)
MTPIDLTEISLVPAIYDPETGRLACPENVVVEESPVRHLGDMPGFFPPADLDPTLPLYHMFNGVARAEHQELFRKHRIRYEYTMLLPLTIGGECCKAHGHIHIHKSGLPLGIPEAYEVLHGTGAFLLFTLSPEGRPSVIILQTKPGDRFVIPPEYYHLSVNTGDQPFIFGDLIAMDAAGDYGPLKQTKGAPLLAFRSEAGIRWVTNRNYAPLADVHFLTVAELPWGPRLPEAPLYGAFLADPDRFRFLQGAPLPGRI